MNELHVIGLDHHRAPVAVREKLAALDAQVALDMARESGIEQAMVLSTCNRYEIYAAVSPEQQQSWQQLQQRMGLNNTDVAAVTYRKTGKDALQHGFRVAGSLESMVVGEPQILGQMKQAFQLATQHNMMGSTLHRFMQSALRVGKRVRSETDIARTPVSVASVAVRQVQELFPDVSRCNVLLVGAGDMGALAARHLKAAGAGQLTVLSRSTERAQALAKPLGARTGTLNQLEDFLTRADVVVCSTAARQPVITAAMVQRITPHKKTPLCFIDMAMPSDVAADVAQVAGCKVYDLDELGRLAQRNQQVRQEALGMAEDIVYAETLAFMQWSEEDKNKHIIKGLRHTFEHYREDVLRRYPQADAATATQLLLNKLLHHPTVAMRRNAVDPDALAVMLETLFPITCTRRRVLLQEASQPAPRRCPLAAWFS